MCVCVREPVVCFCFEDGITNVSIVQNMKISKEAVGNSWDILNAILSHFYHLNP